MIGKWLPLDTMHQIYIRLSTETIPVSFVSKDGTIATTVYGVENTSRVMR